MLQTERINPQEKMMYQSSVAHMDMKGNLSSNWTKWFQSFEIFLIASGFNSETDERKVAMLLHFIGPQGMDIFNSFNMERSTVKFKDLIERFKSHFVPKTNLTMARYKFFTRHQGQEEIEAFLTELKNLANVCDFGNLKESLIKDIFICNMNKRHLKMKEKLLEKEQSLDEAVNTAKAMILSQENVERLENNDILQEEFKEVLKQFKQLREETSSRIDELSKEKEEAVKRLTEENNALKERLFSESSSYETRTNVPLPTPIQLTGDVKSNLEYFEKMWINHLIITNMVKGSEKVKIAMLLSCIGEEACKILYKIENVNDENQTAENLLRKLRNHLIPELNVRFERYLFNTVQQEENESYHAYFIKLKSMVKTCRYEDKEDELLLDKIICSVKDMNIKQKM
ncbi:unnamed protein product [Phaedon cochleariae]|uniref:Retrotransposon gag domain-containing protein n=1 Tax=Phaedon cochleariae TaxID=80249 RepID=A0A9P0DUJ8_PHACE|nr:unnamed protein product [Phaedon cochleariae]